MFDENFNLKYCTNTTETKIAKIIGLSSKAKYILTLKF